MKQSKGLNYEVEISKIASSIHRELSHRLSSLFSGDNLTMSHIIILEFLHEKQICSMSELAQTLKLTMGAATAIIDKMVTAGLVKREHSQKDRRIVNVFLTKRGRRTATDVSKNRFEIIKEVFSVITDKEKRVYLNLLKKIYNGLRNKR